MELAGVLKQVNQIPTWCGGNTTVVQLGDVLDRGDQEIGPSSTCALCCALMLRYAASQCHILLHSPPSQNSQLSMGCNTGHLLLLYWLPELHVRFLIGAVGVLLLLLTLNMQAQKHGGAIWMVNGNHESLNIIGNFRCSQGVTEYCLHQPFI